MSELGPLYGKPIPEESLPLGGMSQAVPTATDLENVARSNVHGALRVAGAYEALAMQNGDLRKQLEEAGKDSEFMKFAERERIYEWMRWNDITAVFDPSLEREDQWIAVYQPTGEDSLSITLERALLDLAKIVGIEFPKGGKR